MLREEGPTALYKGFVPKVLRLAPGGGVLLLVVEFTLDVFRTGKSPLPSSFLAQLLCRAFSVRATLLVDYAACGRVVFPAHPNTFWIEKLVCQDQIAIDDVIQIESQRVNLLQIHSTAAMNARSSNATALRRLMTEYKQLTSGGALVYKFRTDGKNPPDVSRVSGRNVHGGAHLGIRFLHLGGADLRAQRHALCE